LKGRKIYWLTQLYGWSFYLLLVIFWNLLTGTFSPQLLKILLVSFSIGISYSHLYRIVIIKRGWLKLSLAKIILRGIIGSALIGVSISVSIALISDNFFISIEPILTAPYLILVQQIISWTITMQVWTLIYFGYHFVENYKKEEIKNLQLEASMNEVELQNLRTQLNPHFMFNSLNSIRALVMDEPENAREAITKLSGILRYSLTSAKNKFVPLEEEITLVKNYLELEKVRFEERLTFNIWVEPSLKTEDIPPLMLQTLVENAVKHGISKSMDEGFINVEVKNDNENVNINVSNSGKLKPQENNFYSTNIGLSNTRKRLQLLFAEKASFTLIQKETNIVEAAIIYPLKPKLK
jgi:two-component system LytT family sensor kinase